MTDPLRRLVCIDIVAAKNVLYSRTVYTEYVPTDEDLHFYYRELCGLTDAIVTATVIDVPPDFNEALVAFSEQIPTRFPTYDITATLEEADKIAKYHDYIQNLSEMEKSRAKLQVHIKTAATVPSGLFPATATPDVKRRPILKRHAWVREILASFESEETVSDDLVTVESDNLIPHAWILTPVIGSVRADRGSRLLLDAIKGKHWECLLGSSLFPDFVVSRRISTQSWLFQHETADTLLRATLDFYIASQDATIVGGLSSWISIADKEIAMLMNAFKKIKVNERVLKNQEDPRHVYNVLNSIELRCLASKSTNPEIHPLSVHIFRKYFNYVALGLGIPPEKYQNNENITQILRRWERSEFGFRADVDPIVPAWSNMWKLVMAGAPTIERVSLFLATLDAWNPIESSMLSQDQCVSIATEWIRLFIANEVVREEGKYEIALVVYDETRRWCLQNLPVGMFEKILRSDTLIRDLYVTNNFIITKSSALRKMTGLRLRNPSKKTVYEGKVVDKAPGIPEPVMAKYHAYTPSKAVVPTSMGKFVGRPPKSGSAADNARKGILTLMGGGGGGSSSSSSTSTSSSASSMGEHGAPPEGENELIMNLGSI
jgi:hypothetical protein